MAVYRRTYRAYDGPLTPSGRRFLVIPRYVFADMRGRRFLTSFFLVSMLYPLACALLIYINQNANFFKLLPEGPKAGFLSINAQFFMTFLGVQSMAAYFLTAFIGPGLIAPDLANNALPLYLSRPFSRGEYVLGKISVLWILLSVMTWIPGLLLFLLQAYLVGWSWASENLRIAGALFAGAWVWIIIMSLLALALSAWVKWKPAAGALVLGVFFVAAGFGAAVNGVMRTRWGHLMNMSHLVGSVWVSMFQDKAHRGDGAAFFRVAAGEEIPLWCCWTALAVLAAFCVYLLDRKVRGAEVVR
ncbi:MAG: ABC transporter permease [Bryobacteraceae bacterium]